MARKRNQASNQRAKSMNARLPTLLEAAEKRPAPAVSLHDQTTRRKGTTMMYLEVFDTQGLRAAEWESEDPADCRDEELAPKGFGEPAEQ